MGVSVHWQINRNKKMIGETAVPYKNYLVAPIVKFDEKKVKLIKRFSGLIFLVFPLSIVITQIDDLTFKLIGAIIIFICFGVGLWFYFGVKSYEKVGLLEMSEDNIIVHQNDKQDKHRWSEIQNVTLTYLTDQEGHKKPLTNQIKRCSLKFTSNNTDFEFFYLLTYNDMAMAIFNLSHYLNNQFPTIETINSFGNLNKSKK